MALSGWTWFGPNFIKYNDFYSSLNNTHFLVFFCPLQYAGTIPTFYFMIYSPSKLTLVELFNHGPRSNSLLLWHIEAKSTKKAATADLLSYLTPAGLSIYMCILHPSLHPNKTKIETKHQGVHSQLLKVVQPYQTRKSH